MSGQRNSKAACRLWQDSVSTMDQVRRVLPICICSIGFLLQPLSWTFPKFVPTHLQRGLSPSHLDLDHFAAIVVCPVPVSIVVIYIYWRLAEGKLRRKWFPPAPGPASIPLLTGNTLSEDHENPWKATQNYMPSLTRKRSHLYSDRPFVATLELLSSVFGGMEEYMFTCSAVRSGMVETVFLPSTPTVNICAHADGYFIGRIVPVLLLIFAYRKGHPASLLKHGAKRDRDLAIRNAASADKSQHAKNVFDLEKVGEASLLARADMIPTKYYDVSRLDGNFVRRIAQESLDS
ncbi:hypothetical protein V8E55_012093 [Tylopilus felleus]